MTRRSTDNRQKKVVRPRTARGGTRPVRVTRPRPVSRRDRDPSEVAPIPAPRTEKIDD